MFELPLALAEPFISALICLAFAGLLVVFWYVAKTPLGQVLVDTLWNLSSWRWFPGGELRPWVLWLLVGLCVLLAIIFAAMGFGFI